MIKIADTEVVDTFAEAFPMHGARVIITALDPSWAMEAARSMTGFATSVIGCKCEAGVERELPADETPDARPGVSVLLFAMSRDDLAKRLVDRIGQCVMTCPSTACFDGLPDAERRVVVGGSLRHFGDGLQGSKVIGAVRYWRIPVMDGEFVVQEDFGTVKGVGGGNLIISGTDEANALKAAVAAANAMRAVRGVVLPFPGGIVRSGSKVGSRRGGLTASTNDALGPTVRVQAPHTDVVEGVGSVLEIVIDGLNAESVGEAMRVGLHAASHAGAVQVTAGNYGGDLGPFHFHLGELVA
jgi:formylmethanofuran--tetrahydromethanopterin N-formyltransferase